MKENLRKHGINLGTAIVWTFAIIALFFAPTLEKRSDNEVIKACIESGKSAIIENNKLKECK